MDISWPTHFYDTLPWNIQLVKRKFEADDSAMRKGQQTSLESSSGDPEYLHTFNGKQDISFRDFLLPISIDQTKREILYGHEMQG